MANRAKQVEESAPTSKGVQQKPDPIQQTHVSGPGPVLQPRGVRARPGLSGPADILALHPTIGNQAVMRLLDKQRSAVQAKLVEDPEEESVQLRTGGQGEPSNAEIHSAAARGVSTPATTLPFLDRIQASFGRHSIGHIKAHVGPEATRASRDMNALAFASGDHVVFGGSPDLHIAAHEAAHVVQQQIGVQLAGGVGQVGDRYEETANAVADRVTQGRSAADLLPTNIGYASPSIQRVNKKAEYEKLSAELKHDLGVDAADDLEMLSEMMRTQKGWTYGELVDLIHGLRYASPRCYWVRIMLDLVDPSISLNPAPPKWTAYYIGVLSGIAFKDLKVDHCVSLLEALATNCAAENVEKAFKRAIAGEPVDWEEVANKIQYFVNTADAPSERKYLNQAGQSVLFDLRHVLQRHTYRYFLFEYIRTDKPITSFFHVGADENYVLAEASKAIDKEATRAIKERALKEGCAAGTVGNYRFGFCWNGSEATLDMFYPTNGTNISREILMTIGLLLGQLRLD